MQTDKHLRYLIALLGAPNIGSAQVQLLLGQVDDIEALFAKTLSPDLAKALPGELKTYLQNPNWTQADAALSWRAQAANHHLLTPKDSDYPPLLKTVLGTPALLYVHGNPALLKQPQLAIVGSRNPSHAGVEAAFALAKSLNQAGLVITSGLAMGIDTQAHQGALAGNAQTIAVMGTGIDVYYPKRNAKLAQRISEVGALVTEFPLNTPPRAAHFPQRNGIVSGMTVGTLVIEATLRSGSLITARLAGDQGREVFALPGSIHNPLARGCHKLIREGAKLVETADDIIEELGPLVHTLLTDNRCTDTENSKSSTQTLAPDYQKLLECVGFEPTAPTTIMARSQLSAAEVTAMLLQLELNGQISRMPGGYTRIV